MEWEESKMPRVCGTCQHLEQPRLNCGRCLPMEYPLMVTPTDCADYSPKPDWREKLTPFTRPEFPECADCGHCFDGVCSGKQWIPVRRDVKCEFWIDLNRTCKHAVPCLQYGTNYRNNHCTLDPELRTPPVPDKRWACYQAHYTTTKKCWTPAGD
jgi:hypothetical protein